MKEGLAESDGYYEGTRNYLLDDRQEGSSKLNGGGRKLGERKDGRTFWAWQTIRLPYRHGCTCIVANAKCTMWRRLEHALEASWVSRGPHSGWKRGEEISVPEANGLSRGATMAHSMKERVRWTFGLVCSTFHHARAESVDMADLLEE